MAFGMARVVFVQTYPYEAVPGGDALYLHRLRAHLSASGHKVETLITDVTRGRSNPLVQLGELASGHQWTIRNAIPLNRNRFLSFEPRLAISGLARLAKGRPERFDLIDPAEEEWVVRKLQSASADLAVLAFGAGRFASRIARLGVPVLALKGFFSDRRLRLGESLPAPGIEGAELHFLESADRVGFNNSADLHWYEQNSRAKNGCLVGIGFPPQPLQPSADRDKLLFVGARTAPNIEALGWLLDSIWPLVLQVHGHANLRVVGAIGGAFAGRQFRGVEFVGFSSDLTREYAAARIVVAPLTSGSAGVKTKVAEGVAYGRPVVTTPLGVELRHHPGISVADTPQDFAAAIIRLLSDPRHWASEAAGARETFEAAFSNAAAYREVDRLLSEARVRS